MLFAGTEKGHDSASLINVPVLNTINHYTTDNDNNSSLTNSEFAESVSWLPGLTMHGKRANSTLTWSKYSSHCDDISVWG